MQLSSSEIESLIKICAESGVSEFKLESLEFAFGKSRIKSRQAAVAPAQAAKEEIMAEFLEQQEAAQDWFSADPPVVPEPTEL